MKKDKDVKVLGERLDKEVEDRMDLQSRVTKLEKADIVFKKNVIHLILIALVCLAVFQMLTVWKIVEVDGLQTDFDSRIGEVEQDVLDIELWSRQFARDVDAVMQRLININQQIVEDVYEVRSTNVTRGG